MGKGGRCVRLTNLPASCAVVMKSGNLKFLELSGPLQACNGNALFKPTLMTCVMKCHKTLVGLGLVGNLWPLCECRTLCDPAVH